MDKLSAEQQADVKKLSTEALKAKLVKVGYAKEEVAAMERDLRCSSYGHRV